MLLTGHLSIIKFVTGLFQGFGNLSNFMYDLKSGRRLGSFLVFPKTRVKKLMTFAILLLCNLLICISLFATHERIN